MLGLTPTWMDDLVQRTPPKLGWNRAECQKPAISLKRWKIWPSLWRTNRKSHTRFRFVAKLMTFGWPGTADTHSCRKDAFYGARQKNFNEDRSYYQRHDVGQRFYRNITYLRILAWFLRKGASKNSGVVDDDMFGYFRGYFGQHCLQSADKD